MRATRLEHQRDSRVSRVIFRKLYYHRSRLIARYREIPPLKMNVPATTRVDGRNEALWLLGAYDDRYVCDYGDWLFEVMNLHVNLFAPHQGSWADTAVQ